MRANPARARAPTRASPQRRPRRERARARASASDESGAFVSKRRSRRRTNDGDERAADAPPTRGSDANDASTSAPTSDGAAVTFERAYASEEELERARAERRRLEEARERARRERLRACERVIVVEGGADIRAVRSKAGLGQDKAKVIAVRHRGAFRRRPNAEWEVKDERMDEVARLSEKYGAPIVVLFDCDTAGRQLRNAFIRRFPDALHAFLGVRESSAAADTRWHFKGNVGVEHAEGDAIARALENARRADPSREVFTRERLIEWGLVSRDSLADATWADFGGVVERRRLVGEYLGVGDCDGRQLLRQLNLFFSEAEAREAIDALPKRGEPIPEKMTDGRADARARALLARDDHANDGLDSAAEDFELLGFDPMAYVPPGEAPPGFD